MEEIVNNFKIEYDSYLKENKRKASIALNTCNEECKHLRTHSRNKCVIECVTKKLSDQLERWIVLENESASALAIITSGVPSSITYMDDSPISSLPQPTSGDVEDWRKYVALHTTCVDATRALDSHEKEAQSKALLQRIGEGYTPIHVSERNA